MPSDRQSSSAHTPYLKLVVVDDVAEVRRGLRELLALVPGLEIAAEAAEGREAVDRVKVLRPDAVVLDLQMPVMDGFEAATRIKAELPSCRVVALTVHSGEADRRRADAAGIDAYVVKGAPLASLIETVTGPPTSGEAAWGFSPSTSPSHF